MAKYKKIKCPKCDRRFSMAAHLARHLGTIHKRKAKKRVAKKRTSAKRKAGSPKGAVKKKRGRKVRAGARRQPIGDGSARLLAAMRELQAELVGRRESLDVEILAISEATRALGG